MAHQQDAEDDAALGSHAGVMSCPPSWRDEGAWPPSRRLCSAWSPRQAEAEAERQRRAAAEVERQRTGRRRGRAPKEVDETPDDKAQMSFTDAALHIMQTNSKGWDYWR